MKCQHGNPSCTPASKCTACGGGTGVLKDGESIRVSMMFRDSVQRAIAGHDDVRAQARADHEQWKREQTQVQAGASHRGFDDSAGPKGYNAVLAANRDTGARIVADAQRAGERVQGFVDHFRGR